MRRAVPGLGTPHPLGLRLPAMYADDDFAQRLLAALDEVVAPVYATLDNLAAYLDPALAPDDFVDWLAGWVAADSDVDWPVARRREAVACAVEQHRLRGTLRGLAAQVRMTFGVTVEVTDTGGTAWSQTPGADLPGSPEPAVTVRVRPQAGREVSVARLRELVDAIRPAHVAYTVEVLPADPDPTEE
ncbi:phage tail protein I [Planosporangium sp. 12N6]|uniref:phage tail protein I n=1 Tax=Planosporangium spinosum TaxID=3402278 RepID=UPI003CF985F0